MKLEKDLNYKWLLEVNPSNRSEIHYTQKFENKFLQINMNIHL